VTTILADSFTSSLAKLSNDEQKQAKLTAFDLQVNPDQPGLQFHRIDKSRDPNFWSVRVNRDVRIVVHKTGDSLLLVHVAHHDDAYKWAERRRIETHPKTGALQIVEVRELVEASASAYSAQSELAFDAPEPTLASQLLFGELSDENLLSVGVPVDWLSEVRAASEDRFFAIAGHLPPEASEALLEFAATGRLNAAPPPTTDPLLHPDTLRRFRVLEGVEELQAALDAPFEKWLVFLHPTQKGVVDRTYSGPARVAGSAGTGKTVVALHRVYRLLRADPDARVLLTTFSEPLARSLRDKLKILFGERPGLMDRVSVSSFLDTAAQLYALATGRKPHLAVDDIIRSFLTKAAAAAGVTEFTPQFLYSEWTYVIDAWQITTPEGYADVPRMGRKNRLGAKQRERLWQVFDTTRSSLAERGLMTPAGIFAAVTETYGRRTEKPFTHVVVDEAQDLGVAELRFLAAISPAKPDALFFAGDLGQRIFQQPFSWSGLGIDVRGRSATLKVNYRTSHQIRRSADRLLPKKLRDVDGLEDDRAGTVSVFDGPDPEVLIAPSMDDETAGAAAFLRQAISDGIVPAEIGVFVRSPNELGRARAAVAAAGLEVRTFVDGNAGDRAVLVGTMHLAKGLEFRAVVVMACDQGVLPLGERVADVADEFELDEVVATERQLLYVAATRARDRLWISGVEPASEFLEEFRHC
jgi:mRNA-degrading endonuclease RelE of RelBE toxin-antitoxin system